MKRRDRLLTRLRLRKCAEVGEGTAALGPISMRGGGRVVIGKRVVLDASEVPIELCARVGATIEIGDDVRIAGGASLEAAERITIGRGATLGAFSKVLDNNLHFVLDKQFQPIYGVSGSTPESIPVAIGDGADIGERAIVLPGAQLGANVRLEPGTVISRRVPPGVVMAGYPPRRVQQEKTA